jgi:hypothetical protein
MAKHALVHAVFHNVLLYPRAGEMERSGGFLDYCLVWETNIMKLKATFCSLQSLEFIRESGIGMEFFAFFSRGISSF